MQIDLDALERDAREKVLSTGHTFLLPETLLALIAKVRELERRSAAAYQNGMAAEAEARFADEARAKVRELESRATVGQRDTAQGGALSDEEILGIWLNGGHNNYLAFARAILARAAQKKGA